MIYRLSCFIHTLFQKSYNCSKRYQSISAQLIHFIILKVIFGFCIGILSGIFLTMLILYHPETSKLEAVKFFFILTGIPCLFYWLKKIVKEISLNISLTDDNEKKTWPLIRTINIELLAEFYLKKLNFTTSTNPLNIKYLDKMTLKLDQFQIQLIKPDIGPILHKIRQPLGSPDEGNDPVLYIPVENPSKYLESIMKNNVIPLTGMLDETPFLDHNFEGFYIRDLEGNTLCLFKDHHSHYNGYMWEWNYEHKIRTFIDLNFPEPDI